ncbi:uvrD/REP helicase N-terminal domain protein [Collimonas arenae]|uniref:UvrD/REP helicase N-terminal domain protein n=1 Tax=Collimonas arenae TaxID=279058 RepID=A0A127PWC4_9BURK|nr:UvrD-helicase domain-containing protein [Collimonas arenae]AMP02131.1 uvrD/REP helicase N-terminal domain protein [Collimonas arenae]AMP12027.1 uvrD/REP helicase N-terminal domain protein [Collimonas arenae]
MTAAPLAASNTDLDDHVDNEIAEYINLDKPRSFFLFAGAGSGKTRSLVKALSHIRSTHGRQLVFRGQRVGVITYTNAACDEITRRIDFDPLFYVATIHRFAWELIQDFSYDIREWLRTKLAADIVELQKAEAKGRAGTQASITRLAQIDSKTRRRLQLDTIKSFVYSPTGENREANSLNHSEVIELCADFLLSKPLMQWILVGRFPFLLIDESQDTNKRLVDAFFATAVKHPERFALGLVGDVMQRIYADGKEKIEQGLPESWARPSKKLNHRCPKRIVRLINQIRSAVDDHDQESRSDAIEGFVRLFIRPANTQNRQAVESAIRAQMADITDDEQWRSLDDCKILTLEHHMAATRLGFEGILEPLLAVEAWRTSLLDGSLPATRFFTQNILPLIEAEQRRDKFAVARIVRSRSPLLTVEALKDSPDPGALLRRAQDAVTALMSLWKNGLPTCGQILDSVAASGLFTLPEVLKAIVALRSSQGNPQTDEAEKADPVTEETTALLGFLDAPFEQVGTYNTYVSGQASFDTHQGVKGLEFDRVMVLMDDAETRGFMFNYEKLFGAKAPSSTDIKNAQEGKETGLDRTRRLFYVTCSRAEKSLALVVYTENPAAMKAHVLARSWFAEDEIDDES